MRKDIAGLVCEYCKGTGSVGWVEQTGWEWSEAVECGHVYCSIGCREADNCDPVIKRDLERIRKGGKVNMLDRKGVQVIADTEGMYQLVTWLDVYRANYGAILSKIYYRVPSRK